MPWLVLPFISTISGVCEAQVANAAVFLDGGLLSQPFPIDESLPGVGIHGEVADLKGGEVLEEVAALRGRDAEIAETRLRR